MHALKRRAPGARLVASSVAWLGALLFACGPEHVPPLAVPPPPPSVAPSAPAIAAPVPELPFHHVVDDLDVGAMAFDDGGRLYVAGTYAVPRDAWEREVMQGDRFFLSSFFSGY